MTKSNYNWMVGALAAILGPVSLFIALKQSIDFDFCSRACIGRSMLAFWLLIPPVFFWLDWVVFSRNFTPAQREVAQGTSKGSVKASCRWWVGLKARQHA